MKFVEFVRYVFVVVPFELELVRIGMELFERQFRRFEIQRLLRTMVLVELSRFVIGVLFFEIKMVDVGTKLRATDRDVMRQRSDCLLV